MTYFKYFEKITGFIASCISKITIIRQLKLVVVNDFIHILIYFPNHLLHNIKQKSQKKSTHINLFLVESYSQIFQDNFNVLGADHVIFAIVEFQFLFKLRQLVLGLVE